MRVIPVIDLKAGQVVAAKQGRREQYPLLTSRLTDRTDLASVMDGLLAFHSFSAIYIADLDALMGVGTQWPLVERIARRHGDLTFWVDQGLPSSNLESKLPANVVPVVGTESLGPTGLQTLAARRMDYILSLDFRGESLVGSRFAAAEPHRWPTRVIVMSLSHVGSDLGPDFDRLRAFRRRYPRQHLIAAGGIRHGDDLRVLEAIGVHAVLMASALHNGVMDREILAKY